jgi:hypothetical protein
MFEVKEFGDVDRNQGNQSKDCSLTIYQEKMEAPSVDISQYLRKLHLLYHR